MAYKMKTWITTMTYWQGTKPLNQVQNHSQYQSQLNLGYFWVVLKFYKKTNIENWIRMSLFCEDNIFIYEFCSTLYCFILDRSTSMLSTRKERIMELDFDYQAILALGENNTRFWWKGNGFRWKEKGDSWMRILKSNSRN